jgi:transcription factor E
MQVKLLKEIVVSVAGPGAVGLVDLLFGKKNVNEFLIAKKLGLNINQTRNILYKLADEGLVSFIRKKDKKNGGWYTYYWTLDVGKSLANLKNIIVQDMRQLDGQLSLRKNQAFYYCQNCDLEMNEENAMMNNFTCPECGEVFVLRDNTELVKKIEASIEKRKEQLALVDTELGILGHKENALKQRRAKADAKKKKAERALRKKVREAELKKANKISSKRTKRK